MALREIHSSNLVPSVDQSQDDILKKNPPAMQAPKVEHVQNTKSLINVVFHIETTGLGMYEDEITQLSAACGQDKFNIYITSPGSIPFDLYSETEDDRLDEQPVSAGTSAKEAFQKFICWLQKFDNWVVLLAHNGKIFDIPRLIMRLQEHGLLDDFKAKVVGCVDTMILFRNHFSMREKPSLKSLMETIIPGYNFVETHDSLQDVKALKKLLDETSAKVREEHFFDASFTLTYAIQYVDYCRIKRENLKTLRRPLLIPKVITQGMRKKIAGSGLRYCDLEMSYKMAGRDGIERVLSQTINGKPRVTKVQRIILKIYDHFKAL